jgi:hypothetical protein
MGLEIDRRMEPHGLTNAQWLPLIKLYEGRAAAWPSWHARASSTTAP